MRNSSVFWVSIPTFLLIVVTVMATLGAKFHWIFYLTVFGQLLLVFVVYKVLKAPYKSKRTFKDFYEDHTI
ncbi:MAG: hypothetical protein AAF361_04705 [Bacteroidota bacterium]